MLAAAAAAGKAVPSSLWSAAALANGWRVLARSYAADAAAGGAVINVQSQAEYDGILQQLADDGAVGIIDFTAQWCGPCKAIAPIYEQLAKQYPQAKFLKIDIDNAALEAIVADHGITGVPTFAMFKGGRKVETFTGARVDLLRAVLKKHAS